GRSPVPGTSASASGRARRARPIPSSPGVRSAGVQGAGAAVKARAVRPAVVRVERGGWSPATFPGASAGPGATVAAGGPDLAVEPARRTAAAATLPRARRRTRRRPCLVGGSAAGGTERKNRIRRAHTDPLRRRSGFVNFAVPPNEAETARGAGRRDPGSGQLPGSLRFPPPAGGPASAAFPWSGNESPPHRG